MVEVNSDGLIKKKFHIHGDTNSDDKHEQSTFDQEIRERKKSVNQQHHQESSPPKKSPKKTEFFHQIRLKFLSQPRNVKIGSVGAIFSILILLILLISRPREPSPFFHRFGNIVNDIFKEIHQVDLPSANSIMEHTVTCRRVANVVQNNVIFESHGTQIASGLRDFGEKIMAAGRSLRKMYSHGSTVYRSFDIEIGAMMQRFNSNYARHDDARYFKDKLKSLLTKVQEFRKQVEETQSAILSAEAVRNDAERYIVEGLRSAEAFVKIKTEHVVDIEKSRLELDAVNQILVHLHQSGERLDAVRKILEAYEDKLMDLSAELGGAGVQIVNYDGEPTGLFHLTKGDLKFLQGSVRTLKFYHESFNLKAQIPSI